MPATTTLLGLVTPTQGTLSGTWGDTVNYGISDYVDIAVAGTLTLTNDGAVTLANTTGSSSGSSITSSLTGAGTVTAQFAIVKVTGTLTVAKVVTGPSYSKTYTVVNAATGGIVTFKASGQTGVSVAVGESAFVYFNGTDYVKLVGTATAGAAGGSNTQVQFNSSGILAGSSSLTWDGTTLSSTQVNITGQGTLRLQDTTGGEYVGLRSPSALGASYTLTFPADDGTSGQALITDGSGVLSWSTAASGDVYGPGSSTDNAVARFDSTTGKLLQNSVVLIGDTGAVTGVTDLTASGTVTLSGGTANGVAYLNGSKVVTSGSALTFDGTSFGVKAATTESTNVNIGGGRSGSGYAYLDLIGDAAQASSYSARLIRGNGGANTTTSLIHKGTGALEFTASDAGYLTYNINGSEVGRFTSTGLGIGTSSPSQKLDVRGNMYMAATNARIYIDNGGVGGSSVQIGASGTSYGYIGTDGSFPLVFQPNNTERMRLDSSGNLGLGVTPSAWDTLKAIQLSGGSLASFSTYQNFLSANAFYQGGWKYVSTQAAGQYLQDGNVHKWYTAPSGTAGNAITFTQAMTLDASGNLGVGETSPTSRLHVSFTSNSVDNVLQIQQKGNNTASGITLTANDNNGAGYNFIQSTTTGGTTHWRITGGVATSTLAFSTGGSERMRIDSSGNVGIGTSSPGKKLDVVGTIRSTTSSASLELVSSTAGGSSISFLNSSTYEAYISSLSGGGILFGTGTAATERARISSTGILSVGYTGNWNDTAAYLHVLSGIVIGSSASPALFTSIKSSNGYDLTLTANANPANIGVNANIIFSSGNSGGGGPSELGRFTSAGNFGINTSSPGQRLDVNGNIRSRDGAIVLSIGTAQQAVFCTYNQIFGSGTDYTPTIFAETGLGLTFAVNGSATKAMSLTSGGNLLVGTTSTTGGFPLRAKGGGVDGSTTVTVPSGVTTTIYTIPNTATACMCVVFGDNGSSGFCDLLFFLANTTPQVVSSKTMYGSPPARTYSAASSTQLQINVAMDSSTRTAVLGTIG